MIEIRQISLALLSSMFLCQAYPQKDDLYETIVKLDSAFFIAYNTCDMMSQEEFYSDSIEFYHDKGG